MAHFGPEFVAFFRGLKRRNTRPWYHAHKAEYERHVKRPFEDLVEELIHRLAALGEPIAALTPREAIFRLARDTRFSKDKTPYKLHQAAVLAPGGRKEQRRAAFYFQLGADGLAVAGGVYQPDKDQVLAIRRALTRDGDMLSRLLRARSFRTFFDGLEGDRNKRLSPEFAPHAERLPLLYQKQFYFWTEHPSTKVILRRDLADFVVRHWKAGRPVNAWLNRALGSA